MANIDKCTYFWT